ncbi:MAG TPA: hypothetical protein PKN04_00880 [bacterium]|jgi:hypothetical protein|nr:hypothetical protein [bacterium]HNT64313.1 hypothetical protein [bacterium]HOX85303.1 hypothetical protein [bacterium]HPG44462.1 hypothetical protein [bacterium]HPM97020.1 hypothetical protein [bacterium]
MSENKTELVANKADRFNALLLGIIFILAGGLIFADQHHFLQTGWLWWLVFLIGVLLLTASVAQLLFSKKHNLSVAQMIWGPVFIAIGGSKISFFARWWPLILVVTGILLIIVSIRKHEQ